MGNTIVIKASEIAPAPLFEFAKLIDKIGLPKGVINIITGHGNECGKILTSHPLVERIAFTGGVNTARHIVRNSAENLSHVTLELGGKSPQIVFEDANIDKALPFLINAGIQNAGQTCSASSRILVSKKIYLEVAEKMSSSYSK